MATEQTVTVHPGDIIQGIEPGPHHGHFFLVTECRRWGVGAVQRWRDGDEDHEVYSRFKPPQFALVGTAHILPPPVAAARRDSIRTAQTVAKEAGR